MTAVLALAFGAGMVATVNPCGFAMLPAYLSYFMGIQDEGKSRAATLRSALVVGGVVSLGFLVVFGAAGIVISGVSTRLANDWIPWLALAVGVGLTILGLAMLRGFELKVGLPKAGRASTVRSYRNIFGFGVSYAIASLSCTLPVFLTLIATQFSARSFASGLLIFAVYAAARQEGQLRDLNDTQEVLDNLTGSNMANVGIVYPIGLFAFLLASALLVG